MHGGKIVLRSDCRDILFPAQVSCHPATPEELAEIEQYVKTYSQLFRRDAAVIMDAAFTVVVPNSSNPYRQMYVEK